MPINESKLIAAAMLQDYLVDKDTGTPLAAGIITCYKDNARTQLKNWYTQTGSPGDYSYVALTNPLTLSSVGTIQDSGGNDVIPFFYPFEENDKNQSELYYITVDSAGGVRQFTREGFPPLNSSVTNLSSSLEDIFVNGEYWRNGPATGTEFDCENVNNIVVCPAQHDGYNILNLDGGATLDHGSSDIRFIKDVKGAKDVVKFNQLLEVVDSETDVPNPEYSLNALSTTKITGETLKTIQFPAATHIRPLASIDATLVFYAKINSGSTGNTLTLFVKQYLGDDAIEIAPIPLGPDNTVTLTTEWAKFTKSFTFPGVPSDFTVSATGTDGLFIRMDLPTNEIYNIEIAKPQLYLGTTIPTIAFTPYDRIESVINSPRTGDIRLSANNSYPWGYIPMDNGTIGNASSKATNYANVNAYLLYSLLWYTMKDSQSYAPMYSSTGTMVQYGANPQTDWASNNQIQLLKALGQVFAGAVKEVSAAQIFTTDFATDSSLLTITNADVDVVQYGTGTPVVLFNDTAGGLPAGLTEMKVYFTFYVSQGSGVGTLRLTEEPLPSSFTFLPECKSASTATVISSYNNGSAGVGATLTDTAATGAFMLDGVPGSKGDYFLIKDQSASLQNGIYELTTVGDATTAWVLTRATFYDQPIEIQTDRVTLVTGGTAADNYYKNAVNVGAVGVDALTFTTHTFTFVTMTSDGSGTHYIQRQIFNAGQQDGEREHQLIEAELASHVHSQNYNSGVHNVDSGSGSTAVDSLTSHPTGSTGNDVPHNTMQPTTYMNVFIKL